MELSHCFEKGSVVEDLLSESKSEALRELIQKADIFSEIDDVECFKDAVLKREKLKSTGLGRGVAVAHGETEEVKRLLVALGISKKGIQYESTDGEPVHLLFILASPLHDKEYLTVLSAIIRLVRDDDFRRHLLAYGNTEDIENKMHSQFLTCIAKHYLNPLPGTF